MVLHDVELQVAHGELARKADFGRLGGGRAGAVAGKSRDQRGSHEGSCTRHSAFSPGPALILLALCAAASVIGSRSLRGNEGVAQGADPGNLHLDDVTRLEVGGSP